MRTVLVRRAVLTASAVSLALLATACGSAKAGDATFKAGAEPSAARSSAVASSAAPAGPRGRTADELGRLLVTEADLPDHRLEPVADSAAQDDPIETDKAPCKPLAQAEGMQSIGASAGVARVVASGKPRAAAQGAGPQEKADAAVAALKTTATSVALVSYDGKGAEEAFGAVKAGVEACAGGFSVTQAGERTAIESVKADTGLPAGDETVSFVTVMDLGDGDKNVTHVVVLRKGSTLATFTALSLSGDAEQPKAVVDAQAKKL
ncbi:hypothetical protein [Streptomyces sp. A1136]|uniref:hypothetical protein n=1 Tax=Streptomyces sp. A1136 TaxID=2563102 RepID=UPI00109E55E0|nr:hypothetical protein [Streptomyces sp. A1136]THA56402.1 hypothetical protein E6R62_11465 [Streptomyces sp. A1136]